MKHHGFQSLPLFKYQLAAKATEGTQDLTKQLAHEYRQAYDTAVDLNNQLYSLELETVKLRAETQFLHEFINKHMTKD